MTPFLFKRGGAKVLKVKVRYKRHPTSKLSKSVIIGHSNNNHNQ